MKKMKLREYLEHRDTYIRTEVYGEFAQDINKSGISKEEFSDRLKDAFKRASKDFHDAVPDERRKLIERTSV